MAKEAKGKEKVTKEMAVQTVNDKAKLASAGVVLLIALVAFYYFSEDSFFYRMLGIVGGFLIAAAIFFTTAQGKATSSFLATSRVELRRMVWPTKNETLQTTLIVFIVVTIVAIFLWALDRLLSWFMQWLIG